MNTACYERDGLLRLNAIREAGGFCSGALGRTIDGISSVCSPSIGALEGPAMAFVSISVLAGESG